MAYENIDVPAPNMTGDRTNSNFYCFNNGVLLVKQRGSPYSLVNTYPTDSYLGTVTCSQFDGVFYWTLVKQVNGFLIQKWELVSGILRRRASFSYASGTGINYDADSFALEYYNDTLGISANTGATSITVSNGDLFNVGDVLVLGPSSVGAFSGSYETVTISSKAGNVLQLSGSLSKSFSSGDEVYTTRFFYVFNKYSPYDNSKGALLKFVSRTGALFSYSPNHMFGGVRASCFYDSKITFIKGHDVIQLSTSSLNVFKHFSIDNLDTDRAHIVPIYAMWVYSDVVYTLQNKYVFYDVGAGDWDDELWGSRYNYVTVPFHTLVTSVVYFVEVQAEPNIIHAIDVGVPTATSNITVTVLDQARQPLSGQTVSMTATQGSLSPSSGSTDSSGIFTCTYNGTAVATEVEIQATVT